jgi:hypothetical protein
LSEEHRARAGLSYRFVEHPIQTHGLLATLHGVTHHPYRGAAHRRVHSRRRPLLVGLTLTGVTASVAMTLAFASGQAAAIQVDPGKQITITIPGTLSTPRPGPDAPSRGSQPPTASSPPARPPFQRPVRVAARADRPQIAVVGLGAWDVFDNTINGVTLRFGTPASDAYFTRQLDKGVDLLVAAGAQVAPMGVPCYRPIAAGGLPKLPERGDDRRTRQVTALLMAEARTHPERVFMIYPPRQFCTRPVSRDEHRLPLGRRALLQTRGRTHLPGNHAATARDTQPPVG